MRHARALLALSAPLALGAAPVSGPPRSTAPLGESGRIPALPVSGGDAFHDWRRTTP